MWVLCCDNWDLRGRTLAGVAGVGGIAGASTMILRQAESRWGGLEPEPHRDNKSATTFWYDVRVFKLNGSSCTSQLHLVNLSIVEVVALIRVSDGSKRYFKL